TSKHSVLKLPHRSNRALAYLRKVPHWYSTTGGTSHSKEYACINQIATLATGGSWQSLVRNARTGTVKDAESPKKQSAFRTGQEQCTPCSCTQRIRSCMTYTTNNQSCKPFARPVMAGWTGN